VLRFLYEKKQGRFIKGFFVSLEEVGLRETTADTRKETLGFIITNKRNVNIDADILKKMSLLNVIIWAKHSIERMRER
jgi:septum formation topological specificity factor MinE